MKKTPNMPAALVELIENPESTRVQEQILALARGLHAEGIPLRNVTRGLAGAICTLLDEDFMKDYDSFLQAKALARELESGFGCWRFDAEMIEDRAEDIERSRDAGGNGALQ